jgi:hypothetical protein
VGAGADVDAGGVRVLHGQGFDPGGLPLLTGFALDLGPGLAPVVGLAVGLRLGLLGAGRQVGVWLSVPSWEDSVKNRRGKGSGGHAPRRCAGEAAETNHESRLQKGTTGPGRSPPARSGSPVMGPKTSPAQSHIRGRLEGVCATIGAPSQDTNRQHSA